MPLWEEAIAVFGSQPVTGVIGKSKSRLARFLTHSGAPHSPQACFIIRLVSTFDVSWQTSFLLKKFGLSNSNLSLCITVLFGYPNFLSFLFHHRGNPIFCYCTYIVPDEDLGLNMILIGQLNTIRTTYHVYSGGTLPFNNKGLRKGIKSYCEQLTSRKRDQCS